MKAKALRIPTLLICTIFLQGSTPAIAQPQAQDSSEARIARIRRYLDVLRQKEAANVEMPILGTDRTKEIRENLVRELAEELLSLRVENMALKREVEELKRKR